MSSTNDRSETHLNEDTIRRLQEMRRANAAIIGCIEILSEDGVNQGSLSGVSGVFIRLEPRQQMGQRERNHTSGTTQGQGWPINQPPLSTFNV